ncbi:hypothetical protein AUP68_02527 [Ilyonectria robusta]
MAHLLNPLSSFTAGTVCSYAGEVLNIGGEQFESSAPQRLEQVIHGGSGTLDKDVFYTGGEWESVSEESNQTKDEHAILSKNLDTIISLLRDQVVSIVIELGPGTFTKTEVLLQALHQKDRHILYIAVDINKHSLQKHIPALNQRFPMITCVGCWGAFDQALARFKPSSNANVSIWSFGSSLSNAPKEEVVRNFQSCSHVGVSLLLGQDGMNNESEIEAAYHTRTFEKFINNGLQKANETIGQSIFSDKRWVNHFTISKNPTRHTFIIKATEDIGDIKKNCQIDIFTSFKYTERNIHAIASDAGCTVKMVFAAPHTGSRFMKLLGASSPAAEMMARAEAPRQSSNRD